jgi:hypothetical protein
VPGASCAGCVPAVTRHMKTCGANLARAPRRSLVIRAARERCGACLGVLAARRGSNGLGAAGRGVWRARRTLRRAVGVCAQVPAARALLRLVVGRSRRAGAGWARLTRGSIRPWKALRGSAATGCLCVVSELPYPGRRAPRRFLVVRAALSRCGACLCVCLRLCAFRWGRHGVGRTSSADLALLLRAVSVSALAPPDGQARALSWHVAPDSVS